MIHQSVSSQVAVAEDTSVDSPDAAQQKGQV